MGTQVVEKERNGGYKVSVFDLYMKLLFIMPVVALLQDKIDFINRLCVAIIFVMQVILLFAARAGKKVIMLLAIAVGGYILAFAITPDLKFDNNIVHYINFILYANLFITKKESMKRWIYRSGKYMNAMAMIWSLAVFASIFLPSSYYIKEGGERYFGSFMGSVFRLGPTALFIATIAVILIGVHKQKKAIIYMVMPLYCVFMGSSRTYFAIIVFVFVIGMYMMTENKKIFVAFMIVCACAGAYVFGQSAMSEKVAHTLNEDLYGDFWFRLTSGRTVIWGDILSHFKELPIWNMLVGAGHGFSVNVSEHVAHNDYIEILVTYGIAGLLVYLVTVFESIKACVSRKTPFIITICCVLIWFVNAMFNMFCFYLCAALSFPLLLIAVECFSGELKEKKRRFKIKIKI